jgi:hypothetical protein
MAQNPIPGKLYHVKYPRKRRRDEKVCLFSEEPNWTPWMPFLQHKAIKLLEFTDIIMFIGKTSSIPDYKNGVHVGWANVYKVWHWDKEKGLIDGLVSTKARFKPAKKKVKNDD